VGLASGFGALLISKPWKRATPISVSPLTAPAMELAPTPAIAAEPAPAAEPALS